VSDSNDAEPLFSFAVIADTHITDEEGLAIDGTYVTGKKVSRVYRDLIQRVNDMQPAFVVHLGDITHPTPTSSDYGDAALAFHKASEVFSMPYHLVPGNHDIGEKIHSALPQIDDQVSINNRAVGQYEQHFGRQRYSFEYQDCLFLVINTMLLNSGLEQEHEQWQWLEGELRDNAEKRVFVFAHYPLYLSSKDEHAHYDNIEEPSRSRLLDMLASYRVVGYYAGHVHNFFYNHLNGMHQFVLPSTSIIRHDYQEFFRSTPTREMGRFDPAKTGFFWIDVYADRHVPFLIRTNNHHPHRVHSWNTTAPTLTLDLRMPWCDLGDVATPWAAEIFERKLVRNDYPLSALWEMGIKAFRIPVSDLLDERVARRVEELSGLGHTFTVVMFGAPDDARCGALERHGDALDAVEIVALFSQWPEMTSALAELRQCVPSQVFLNPVRPEVQGWTTSHGLHADLHDELAWVLAERSLRDAVDGFVFGVRPDVAPVDGYTAVQQCLAGSGYEAVVHVPCVGFDRTSAPTDEVSRQVELARVAEAALLARSCPTESIVIDNFVELDRGYFNCRGLVDRFYNPEDGSRLLTSLHALITEQLKALSVTETAARRFVSAETSRGTLTLVLTRTARPETTIEQDLSDKSKFSAGVHVDLVSGETSAAESAMRAQPVAEHWSPPALLMQDAGVAAPAHMSTRRAPSWAFPDAT